MRIAGTATLHAPVETVYQTLRDPAVLVRTIPGCERLEEVGEDAYAMTVTAGVASIRGTYAGDVRLTDHQAPNGFVLRASGSGTPGTVSADVTVQLTPGDNGTTVIAYDADAVVGGMLGGVGQRLLTTVAKRTAGEFFTAVDEVLAGGGEEEAALTPGMAQAASTGTGEAGVGAAGTAEGPRPGTVASPGAAGTFPTGAGEVGAFRTGAGEVGAAARADGGGAGPRVYSAPARRRSAGPPGGEFAAGVVLGAAAALLGALVGGYLARRAARPRHR
jgi:carbon monoxide dehydrogenase subunit G